MNYTKDLLQKNMSELIKKRKSIANNLSVQEGGVNSMKEELKDIDTKIKGLRKAISLIG